MSEYLYSMSPMGPGLGARHIVLHANTVAPFLYGFIFFTPPFIVLCAWGLLVRAKMEKRVWWILLASLMGLSFLLLAASLATEGGPSRIFLGRDFEPRFVKVLDMIELPICHFSRVRLTFNVTFMDAFYPGPYNLPTWDLDELARDPIFLDVSHHSVTCVVGLSCFGGALILMLILSILGICATTEKFCKF